MNQLVVVLSRDYASGLSVIRSLGAAGYTVDFVAGALSAGQSAIAASSKYVHKAAEVVYGKGEKASKEAEKKLIDELLAHKGKKGAKPVLFPTDDFSVAVVDRHRSELEPFFLTPSILDGDGLMTPLMDKNMQAKMARRAGFCTPREWTFDLSREIALLEGIVLKDVPEGRYFLSAAPLCLAGADGAPCRAYLIGE